uniref:Putative secreted protein n=1 Tax=Anopheles marajoara TaxID=58244 RepID=A0A2M4CE36_9DIPT
MLMALFTSLSLSSTPATPEQLGRFFCSRGKRQTSHRAENRKIRVTVIQTLSKRASSTAFQKCPFHTPDRYVEGK